MWNVILWIIFAILACAGFVELLGWTVVRSAARKGGRPCQLVPVGGKNQNLDRQLASVYASLQWEANPADKIYILYNTGADQQGLAECRAFARDLGIEFVETEEELLERLRNLGAGAAGK